VSTEPQTWHYGVVARWWVEFNQSGPEIDYFRRFVEAGQPALDVACGTGRLLLPFFGMGSTSTAATSRRTCSRTAERALSARVCHRPSTHRRCTSSTSPAGTERCSCAAPSGSAVAGNRTSRRCAGCTTTSSPAVSSCSTTRPEPLRPWPEPSDRRLGADGTEYALSRCAARTTTRNPRPRTTFSSTSRGSRLTWSEVN
jgi:hypothetical protein